MAKPRISVIVPTYNEAPNVVPLVRLLDAALAGIPFEVIFVDDDSEDGTAETVRSLAQNDPRVRIVHRVGRKGLSSACMEGFMTALAPVLAVMDGDLQHDEKILPQMLRMLETENLDIVIGSRNTEGGGMGNFSASRVKLSNLGKKLAQYCCRTEVSDPMSGYFAITRRLLNEIVHDVSSIGFKILVDILASAKRPLRIGEVAYTFRDRQAGESKLDTLVLIEFGQLLFDKLTGRLLPPRLVLFGAVGALGVLINIPCLFLLYRIANWPYENAFWAASLIAMTCNFFLNNLVTYRSYRLKGAASIFMGLASFWVFCSIGAWMALGLAFALRNGGVHWLLASVVAIGSSSLWNFFMTGMFTWRIRSAYNLRGTVASNLLLPNSLN